MREVRDESDNEDNEGVEADAGGTLHGGVNMFILMCIQGQFWLKID